MAEVKTGGLSLEEGAGNNNTNDVATIYRYENLTDSLADNVAGGMGRHLGVFSCTMLMYVLSYQIPTHY